jgi:hypothetical protein
LALNLTRDEENEFTSTTFDVAKYAIRELQMEQERNENMMYLKRLEPFLESMQQFSEAVEAAEVFSRVSHIMAHVWVSPKRGVVYCLD